jgi:hypothetical protein
MSSFFEENRLINLLRQFDTNFTLSYLEKLRKFKQASEDYGLINSLIPIKDPTLVDPIAFRIEFSEPLFVLLSHPLCRMRMSRYFPIEFEWERFYVTRLGMLPVYFVDFNVITLIKFWGEAAEQVSPQALQSVLTQETTCMELRPATKVSYSTMNFIIPFGAELFNVSKEIDEIMRSYFKYSFWLGLKQGFSFSTHFLHTKTSIKYLLKVAKTLCLIDEINGYTEIQILDRTIKAHKATIRMLIEKDGTFFFQRREVYVPDDVLNDLSSFQAQYNLSLRQSFLNAIVLEVREKSSSFELLNVISDIGTSYFELVKTLISIALMRIFNSNDRITYVCDINELKTTFNNMVKQIGRYVELPATVSDGINNPFDLALESYYPIFIKEESKIYYLHPLLFSFLQPYSHFLLQKDDKKKTIKFLDFLEKMNNKTRYTGLYFDDTLDMFNDESKGELLSKLFKLTQRIKIAKLLQRYF